MPDTDHLTTDCLVAELTSVFFPTPFDAAAFARANGSWDAYTKAEAFDVGSQGKAWDALGSDFVDAHGGALFFLAADAFVAILPAYLAALLRGETDSEMSAFVFSQLTRTPRSDKFDARYALLSGRQKAAIARVLEVLAQRDHGSRYRSQIAASLGDWRSSRSREV